MAYYKTPGAEGVVDYSLIMQEKGTDVNEYTYEDPLPVDYSASATHVLALHAEMDPVGRHGESISNIVYSFVPNGSAVETTRNLND